MLIFNDAPQAPECCPKDPDLMDQQYFGSPNPRIQIQRATNQPKLALKNVALKTQIRN